MVYTSAGHDHSANTGAIAGGLIGGFAILIVVVALILVGLIVSNKKGSTMQIYLFQYLSMYAIFIAGKAVSNPKKEVVYEEPNLSHPVPKKDPGVELEQCPAYGVVQ